MNWFGLFKGLGVCLMFGIVCFCLCIRFYLSFWVEIVCCFLFNSVVIVLVYSLDVYASLWALAVFIVDFALLVWMC